MIDKQRIYLYFGIFMLFSGMSIHWIGIHNIDNCQNMIRMQYDTNLLLCENNINQQVIYEEMFYGKKTMSLLKCYSLGIDLTLIGFFTSILGGLITGKNITRGDKN